MTAYLPSYKETGQGPALIFLHGLGGNRHSFDLQFAALADRYRCIAWDVPGYGNSPTVAELTFDVLSQGLTTLLAELNIAPYAIIGHSLGGMVAQTWVAQGGVTQKLVLAQTSAQFGKPGSQWNAEFLAARLKPLDEGKTPADFAEPLIRSMFHNPDDDPHKQAAIQAGIATMAPLPAAVYRQVINCLVTFNATDKLEKISVPTLCLAAQYDTTAPSKAMQQMAATIPNAQFKCIANAGHLAYIEAPQAFTAALEDFFGA
jgi:3-oxoadipate enol-lactonase